MTTNQQMFLYAVEEMNFTKAAQRAFVTQQCLSDHIHRLEELYGVRLFERSPKLSLTSAGETLYQSLLQIQSIERRVQQQFSGNSDVMEGNIRLGIHVGRARLLLPQMFAAYHRKYPHIKLSVVLGQTNEMLAQMMAGKLDLVLGVNSLPNPQLSKKLIIKEGICLLATEELLRRHVPKWSAERTELNAEELTLLPLSGNPEVSTIKQQIDQFLTSHDIVLNYICAIGDYQTQLQLCKLHQSAFFCPESFLLDDTFLCSQVEPGEERIRALSLAGLNNEIRVELITHNAHYLPNYTAAFQDMLIEQYRERIQRLRDRKL